MFQWVRNSVTSLSEMLAHVKRISCGIWNAPQAHIFSVTTCIIALYLEIIKPFVRVCINIGKRDFNSFETSRNWMTLNQMMKRRKGRQSRGLEWKTKPWVIWSRTPCTACKFQLGTTTALKRRSVRGARWSGSKQRKTVRFCGCVTISVIHINVNAVFQLQASHCTWKRKMSLIRALRWRGTHRRNRTGSSRDTIWTSSQIRQITQRASRKR